MRNSVRFKNIQGVLTLLLETIPYENNCPVEITVSNIREFPIHYHHDLEIIFLLKGSAILKTGCTTDTLSAGDVFTVSPHSVHGIRGLSDEDLFAVIHVNGDFLASHFPDSLPWTYHTKLDNRNDPDLGWLKEQLLQLSKKANALQDEIDQLTQLESDLRRMSGAGPAQDDGASDGSGLTNDGTSGKHDGQGGPYVQQPSLDNVSEALDNVEKDIEKRRASLLELQEQLKAQQESLGTPGMVSLPGSLVGSTVSVTTPTGWPARGEVSSPYGLRWNGSDFHPGIDIANDMGTPIVATADGTVTTAGWNAGGYGNMVDIDHGNGIMTRYGHAMQVVVSAGQHVRRGQIIAYMGSTGFSTGPHVHYEVRVNGQTVNPVSYL